MKRRRFGRTNIDVSELVFGGGFVGGILIHADDDTRREAIRRALAGGINWIDTAPSYGDGQSETALGWLLAELDEPPRISTKVSVDPSRPDDIAGQIERSVEASLGRLRRDSVDLLQLHNPLGPDGDPTRLGASLVLGDGGVADGLRRMQDQGVTAHVGITALGDPGACCRVIDSGAFDTAQVYYNMINPSAARELPAAWTGHSYAGIVDACRRQDMGIMAIRILAAGVLATDVRTGREIPVNEDSDVATEERRARAAFDALGDDHGTRAQTAIRFALSNADVSCAIVGLASLDHLDEALAGAASGPLPAAALDRLESVYATGFERAR